MTSTERAVSVCFSVSIDIHNLGRFTSCEGLGMEVVMETREEGGNNGFVWQLPTRIKYPNIKLSRPIGKDSADLARWVAGMVNGVTPTTAVISALSSWDDKMVAQWSLAGVIPVRWTGPTLNYDTNKAAMETLEIAHHGLTVR